MTEKKLHERLMCYKKKYGVTQEMLQHYKWAVELLKQRQLTVNSNSQEEGV
ncbi:hypothetical protein ATE84_0965 [Aquimarina sp. MAR_2010_214]|uniref:hypothetical protein n=1 Tax=Aquimarina sp. MAR_2010_214 TaxID=1250026 RepID=UPI000CAE6968|nr:hypothetical protein [Aquimarina sp. MAR_2010_214]PKV48949.1 hypothetical protein ATE84_0965 [Aquimarina sp. MAR_2010_214]